MPVKKPRRLKITREKGVELKPRKKGPRKSTTKRLTKVDKPKRRV